MLVRRIIGVFASAYFKLKMVFRAPTHRFSHYAFFSILALVMLIGLSTPKSQVDTFRTDPFLGDVTSDEVNQVTYVQSVATIAGIIDPELGEKAFEIADKEEVAPILSFAAEGFLSKPVLTKAVSSEIEPSNEIIRYKVRSGDTLWSIAAEFDITTDTIRWANNIRDENFVKPGQVLLIPPCSGVLYRVKQGDTLQGIAEEFKGTLSLIMSFNNLENEKIHAGMLVFIPDGVKADPAPVASSSRRPTTGGGYSPAPSRVNYSRSSYNRFPYGYCTWYVASRRNVPWNGNAWQWYGNARAAGYSTGRTPVPGAIMVTWESPIGHVAFVESVSGNSFTVSEMNYRGWGVVSQRTVTVSSVPLIGFIY